MKTISKIISILFIFGFGFAGGYFCAKYGSWWYQPKIEKLTILEAEEKYPIEILSPMVRELQEHANRHGAELIEDNIYGPETAGQLDKLRCDQMCCLIMEKMSKAGKNSK